MLTASQETAKTLLRSAQGLINRGRSEIEAVARAYIPDYHFLDYRVSTFWECDESPVGMCVFKIEEIRGRLQETVCRYCGNPVERK